MFSKKLTETVFCVTKNRFFLILFLICVNRTTVRRSTSWRSELVYHTILRKRLSSIFCNFFRIFSEFFYISFDPISCCLALRTACLSYHNGNLKSTVFRNFFHKFFDFFCLFFGHTIYCVFPSLVIQ